MRTPRSASEVAREADCDDRLGLVAGPDLDTQGDLLPALTAPREDHEEVSRPFASLGRAREVGHPEDVVGAPTVMKVPLHGVHQGACFTEVRSVEPFSESAVHVGNERVSGVALSQVSPETRQAHRSAELE